MKSHLQYRNNKNRYRLILRKELLFVLLRAIRGREEREKQFFLYIHHMLKLIEKKYSVYLRRFRREPKRACERLRVGSQAGERRRLWYHGILLPGDIDICFCFCLGH
jgi:hypothetical protein